MRSFLDLVQPSPVAGAGLIWSLFPMARCNKSWQQPRLTFGTWPQQNAMGIVAAGSLAGLLYLQKQEAAGFEEEIKCAVFFSSW